MRLLPFTALLSVAAVQMPTAVASYFDSVDLIVVGRIASGEWMDASATGVILVDHAVKGKAAAGQFVKFQTTSLARARRVDLTGLIEIWFLQAPVSGDTWHIVSAIPQHSAVPFRQLGLAVQYGDESNPVKPATSIVSLNWSDQLAAEIASSLKTFPANRDPNYDYQRHQLSMAILSIPSTQSVIVQLQALTAAQDIYVKMAGIAGLLRADNTVYLANVLQLPASFSASQEGIALVSAVASVHDGSVSTIANLQEIATRLDMPLGLKRAAATVLAHIHTLLTLPALYQLLSSPDQNMQKSAVLGFSLFIENLRIISPESVVTMSWRVPAGPALFKTTDTNRYSKIFGVSDAELSEHVVFWRRWYQANQATDTK